MSEQSITDQEHTSGSSGWEQCYDVTNLLLTIAWLGEVTRTQLQRLCLPSYSEKRVREILVQLAHEGYIEQRPSGVITGKQRDGRPLVKRAQSLRSLTRAGHQQVADHPHYPRTPRKLRSKLLLPHDTKTTEILVRIIELGRLVGLSSVWVEHEVRLDPARTRPVMDAFVVARLGGARVPPFLVPWTNDGRMAGERSGRLALENDRGTEGRRDIELKALAYQQAGTPAWIERYGAFPIPTWVAPTQQRLMNILRWWAEVWPQGRWLMTTDAGLQRDQWIEYQQGQVATRALFRQANAASLMWVPVEEWLAGAAAAQSTAPNEIAPE